MKMIQCLHWHKIELGVQNMTDSLVEAYYLLSIINLLLKYSKNSSPRVFLSFYKLLENSLHQRVHQRFYIADQDLNLIDTISNVETNLKK